MAKQIDKISTTFYGDDEIRIAQEFRNILMRKNKSLNETLKVLIKKFNQENN